MAKTIWPGREALGECLFTGETLESARTCARIVGVVRDARRFSLNEDPSMHYYVPFGQERGIGGTQLLVRGRGEPLSLVSAVRRALLELDPSISYVQAETLQESVDPQIRPWRLGASMFGLMGVLALIVAAIGLYSVLSYLVAQRTHELGVRIALGARDGDILRLVARSSLGMALLGIAIGLVLSLAAGRFVAPLLFQTSPADPAVLGGVALVMLAAALLASLVPAIRAKRVNPMEALRAD
jgi:ABC-type antimicrobial peptide transport system permease subunit